MLSSHSIGCPGDTRRHYVDLPVELSGLLHSSCTLDIGIKKRAAPDLPRSSSPGAPSLRLSTFFVAVELSYC